MIYWALGGWGLLLLDKQGWQSRRMYLAHFHGILVLHSGSGLCGPRAGCNIGAVVADLKGKVWIFKVFKTKYTPMLLTRINSHWGSSKQTTVVNGRAYRWKTVNMLFLFGLFRVLQTWSHSHQSCLIQAPLCIEWLENCAFSGLKNHVFQEILRQKGENSS